ncbi:MAG: helix-turn-helix transcriptional regulator [Sulfolobales archaeon]|nr:helix-turn-helix transcriptional regulator [Ignisphaera sp.]MCX8199723.1 helix-turn-helix transcriptional regulator [Sulfolobales archaeon]MDW8085858.1 helix-turn-helix transcriptional regulator [Ignisphaera sp.]
MYINLILTKVYSRSIAGSRCTHITESRALKRLRRKITIEVLWIYIAKALKNSEPLKAYEIRKRLRELYGLRVSAVTVYSVVYRMHREGLLEKTSVGGETLYRLSERGLEELEKALELIESVTSMLRA